jgi:hypothetical protein
MLNNYENRKVKLGLREIYIVKQIQTRGKTQKSKFSSLKKQSLYLGKQNIAFMNLALLLSQVILKQQRVFIITIFR